MVFMVVNQEDAKLPPFTTNKVPILRHKSEMLKASRRTDPDVKLVLMNMKLLHFCKVGALMMQIQEGGPSLHYGRQKANCAWGWNQRPYPYCLKKKCRQKNRFCCWILKKKSSRIHICKKIAMSKRHLTENIYMNFGWSNLTEFHCKVQSIMFAI